MTEIVFSALIEQSIMRRSRTVNWTKLCIQFMGHKSGSTRNRWDVQHLAQTAVPESVLIGHSYRSFSCRTCLNPYPSVDDPAMGYLSQVMAFERWAKKP